MKKAPIPEITVKSSPKKINEIIIATSISIDKIIVEATAEIYFKAFVHRKQGISQQNIEVYKIIIHTSVDIDDMVKTVPAINVKGNNGKVVAKQIHGIN